MPTIYLKRLAVWLLEMSCQVLLLIALVFVLSGGSSLRSLADDLALAFFGVAIVFMIGSGYVLTTAIFGIIWRSHNPWVYPTIAAALFIGHEQLLFTGWELPDASHLKTQVGGACIVFACTFFGGRLLRKWVDAGG